MNEGNGGFVTNLYSMVAARTIKWGQIAAAREVFFVYKMLHKHTLNLESLVQKLKGVKIDVSGSMLHSKVQMTLPDEYQLFPPTCNSTATDEKTISNLTNRLMKAVWVCIACIRTENKVPVQEENRVKNIKTKMASSRKSSRKMVSSAVLVNTGTTIAKNNHLWENFNQLQSSNLHGNHTCNRDDWFISYKNIYEPIEILLGYGDVLKVYGDGDLNILSFNRKHWVWRKITGVLYAPV